MTSLSDIWGASDLPDKPPVVDPFIRCAEFVHERVKTLKACGYTHDQIRPHLCMTDITYSALVNGDYGQIRTERSVLWVRELAVTHLPATSLDDHRKMLTKNETLLS